MTLKWMPSDFPGLSAKHGGITRDPVSWAALGGRTSGSVVVFFKFLSPTICGRPACIGAVPAWVLLLRAARRCG